MKCRPVSEEKKMIKNIKTDILTGRFQSQNKSLSLRGTLHAPCIAFSSEKSSQGTQSYKKVQTGSLSENLKPQKNFPSDSAYVFLQVQLRKAASKEFWFTFAIRKIHIRFAKLPSGEILLFSDRLFRFRNI